MLDLSKFAKNGSSSSQKNHWSCGNCRKVPEVPFPFEEEAEEPKRSVRGASKTHGETVWSGLKVQEISGHMMRYSDMFHNMLIIYVMIWFTVVFHIIQSNIVYASTSGKCRIKRSRSLIFASQDWRRESQAPRGYTLSRTTLGPQSSWLRDRPLMRAQCRGWLLLWPLRYTKTTSMIQDGDPIWSKWRWMSMRTIWEKYWSTFVLVRYCWTEMPRNAGWRKSSKGDDFLQSEHREVTGLCLKRLFPKVWMFCWDSSWYWIDAGFDCGPMPRTCFFPPKHHNSLSFPELGKSSQNKNLSEKTRRKCGQSPGLQLCKITRFFNTADCCGPWTCTRYLRYRTDSKCGSQVPPLPDGEARSRLPRVSKPCDSLFKAIWTYMNWF